MAKKAPTEQPGEGSGIPDPAEMTVQELKEIVSSGELSDEELERLREAEAEAKGRKTALEAIESALEASEASPEEAATGDAGPTAANDAAPANGADTGGDGETLLAEGQRHVAQGQYGDAEHSLAAARARFESDKSQAGVARAVEQMAILALARGQHDEAQRFYGEARELYEAQGDSSAIDEVHRQLQLLARLTGQSV